jgi:hypothetical protein
VTADVNAQHLAAMGLAGVTLGEPIREKDSREYLNYPNGRCPDVYPEDPDVRCVLEVDHEQPYHVRGQRSWRTQHKEPGMTLTCDRAKESIPHAAHSYTVGEITHDCPGFLATVCARSRFGFVQADEPVCTFLYGHQGDHSWAETVVPTPAVVKPPEPDYRFVERILDAYFDGGALDFQGLPVPEEIQIYLADKILDQTNQEQ